MQHNEIGDLAGELHGLRADGHQADRRPVVQAVHVAQHGPFPGRAIVIEDHLAGPEPAQDAEEVAQPCLGHHREADRLPVGPHPAAERHGEPAFGHCVHRRPDGCGHGGVTGVVVGRRRDAQRRAGARDGATEDAGVLHGEALADVAGAQPERLGGPGLGQHHPGIGGVPGDGVVAELVELVWRAHGAPFIGDA